MQILFARLFSRITPTEPTFGLVANEWLDSVSTCVKRSTYSVYSAIAAKYIPLGLLICLYTGLRLGEICAMKWGDISYADKSLRVRRTVQRIRAADAGPDEPKTRLVFDSPKSAHSNRVVPVPGFLLEMAESFRCADETYMLTGEEDRCLDPRTYQNRFFVMLRHTFATNCVDMGCDPKALCEILGHSDVSITLNIYVHPSVPAKRELIEQLSSRTDIARNKVQKLRAPHMRRPLSVPW